MNQVQDSSDCCINSKYSAAQRGYFQDDFLSLYVKKLHPRSPIINRGYYIRFKAIDEVFLSWWQSIATGSSQKFQIISLGAGYDSSYFRLKRNEQLPPYCHYVEVDFPDVMKRKFKLVKTDVGLSKNISLEHNSSIVFCSEEYSMIGTDLTNIPVLQKCFDDIGITYSIPTLFLSECSITYIEPESSETFIIWVQKQFPHSIFVAYEQVYPNDAFGLIMRNHFKQVGCTLKSIEKYPDEENQCERFKKLGWTDCTVITMYNLFNSLPLAEKQRIKQLEMFDEYEMWHEKCHHYILLWAAQGIFSRHKLPFLKVRSNVHNPFQSSLGEKTLNWKCVTADEVAHRFGHQVIPLSSSIIILSGGFGTLKKRHQRLGDISLYDIETKEFLKVALEEPHLIGNRMFHSITKLSNNILVILGGRSSPKKIFQEILVCSNCCSAAVAEKGKTYVNLSELKNNYMSFPVPQYKDLMPIPCWRHSASLINIKGIESIFVFGGCSEEHTAINECFILNTEIWTWSKINTQPHTPCPRHSHSAVAYGKSHVIVTGGLKEDETILQSSYMFDAENWKWCELPISGLLPRYCHTSHIWNDHLFLVGGVTCVANFKLGVAVINLTTLQALEVQSPMQDPEYPILLCNHSSYIWGDGIFIVGGGGNCFSFGTHFNKKIISFDLKQLI